LADPAILLKSIMLALAWLPVVKVLPELTEVPARTPALE